MNLNQTNEPERLATAREIDDAAARKILLEKFKALQAPVEATDFGLDDRADITIRNARVMYTTQDHSQSSPNLVIVVTGGTRYVLSADPGAVTVAKVESEAEEPAEKAETGAPEGLVQMVLDRLNGFNADLDQAVDWAFGLPHVYEVYGPTAEGDARVQLIDGNGPVLEFVTVTKRWVVAVSDECDTGSEVAR